MNEILLIAPTPDKLEWPAVRDRIVKLAQRLEKRLKEEDPSRVNVMAFYDSDLYNTIGLCGQEKPKKNIPSRFIPIWMR